MAAWKLPLIAAAITVPTVAGFVLGGPAIGVAAGALAALAIVVVAVRQRPLGPIGAGPGEAAPGRHVLVVAACPVEEPDAVEAVVREVRGRGGEDADVLVMAPASIGFLDRWASDVADARQRAQEKLVTTVAALAKAGVDAQARVGDEDIVQAVEDQLGSYPADEVVLVTAGGPGGSDGDAAAELRDRLRIDFHHVTLSGA